MKKNESKSLLNALKEAKWVDNKQLATIANVTLVGCNQKNYTHF